MFDLKKYSKAANISVFLHTASGFFIGMALIVIATYASVMSRYGHVTFSNALDAHRGNPVLWVVDAAALMMVIIAAFLGGSHERAGRQKGELEQLIRDHAGGLFELCRRLEEKILDRGAPDALPASVQPQAGNLVKELDSANAKIREAVDELRYLLAEMKENYRARGDLVADLSREMRAPLTNIIGMTEQAIGSPDHENRTGYIVRANAQAQKLLSLIEVLVGSPAGAKKVIKVENAEVDADEETEEPETPAPHARKPLKILVADDNVVGQIVVSRMLRSENHTLEFADDGREVVELLEKQPFDLVFLGIDLPDISGLEVTGIVREKERTRGGYTPIVGLVSEDEREQGLRGIETGMDDILRKPVDRASLAEVVEKITRKNRSPRQRSVPAAPV